MFTCLHLDTDKILSKMLTRGQVAGLILIKTRRNGTATKALFIVRFFLAQLLEIHYSVMLVPIANYLTNHHFLTYVIW
jgi:hypothetical protein